MTIALRLGRLPANLDGGQLWFESGHVHVEGNTVELNARMDRDGPRDETTDFLFTVTADTMRLQQMEAGSLVDLTLVRRP